MSKSIKTLFTLILAIPLLLHGCNGDDNSELLTGILLSSCDEATGLATLADAVVESESSSTIVISSAVIEECGSVVTEYGVCYSTSPLPTVSDSKVVAGAGQGNFSVSIAGLQQFTLYYFRAYAINEKGVSYGSELSALPGVTIGQQGPAGGLIFYDKGNSSGGWRYLEAAPASTEGQVRIWGCSGLSVSTSDEIGSGLQNSQAIVNACNTPDIAAKVCLDLVHNGYDDWFLPSLDELNLVRQNLYIAGTGGFSSVGYWSSSHYTATAARAVDFNNGNPGQAFKDGNLRVRAVRRF